MVALTKRAPRIGPSIGYRRLPTLGLIAFLAGCAPDGASDSSAEELPQQRVDDGGMGPSVSPFPAAPLPGCNPFLSKLERVFSYPMSTQVAAAATSRDGYVLLSFRGAAGPLLKLVRAPSGAVDTDLFPLLPAPQNVVSFLSKIRGHRVLAVHDTNEPRQQIISSIDLRAKAVVWSRPLKDLSNQPRPRFDEQGNVLGEWRGSDLRDQTVYHVSLQEDGRYSVLARDDGVLYLFGFEADGAFRFRTTLHPDLRRDPKLVERDDGTLEIVVEIDQNRKAFERLHGSHFAVEPNESLGPVVISVSEGGVVTSLHHTSVPSPNGWLVGGAAIPRWGLSWFVSNIDWPKQRMVSLGPDGSTVTSLATPIDFHLDSLDSMAVHDGALYVAGRLDMYQSISGPAGGTAFMGRIASDGTMPWSCVKTLPPPTTDPSRRPPVSAPLGFPVSPLPTYTMHPTDVPLLSANVALDSPQSSLGVYLLKAMDGT